MKWIKDKTYWFCKYNTAELKRISLEIIYTKKHKESIKEIAELEARIKYLEDKNRLYRQKDKERKENERGKITKDNK